MNNTVSTIIRTIDNNFELLDRAIFSIDINTYPNKEVIIVYQGLNNPYFEKLNNFKNIYPDLNFIFIQNPTNEDERAKNLNLGIKASSGRYITILDDDDFITQEHIANLVNKLIETQKAWGFSKHIIHFCKNNYLLRKGQLFYQDEFRIDKLFKHNFISLHTLIIDKEKIDTSLLRFNEDLKRLEDYYFLLILASNYEPAEIMSMSAIYNWPEGIMKSVKEKEIWKEPILKVEELKEKLKTENYLLKSLDKPKEKTLFSFKSKKLKTGGFKIVLKNIKR